MNIIRPSIERLLFICCPAAVRRLIVAVVVNSIKCFSNWTMTHIFKKVFKLFPTLTDCNSPASIIFPIFAPWISAPVYYSIPRFINFCIGHAMGFCALERLHSFILVTTAASSVPCCNGICPAFPEFSTFTPARTPLHGSFFELFKNSKASIFFSFQVNSHAPHIGSEKQISK